MAQKPFNIHAAFRGAARRVFARSPKVRQVLMAGRREVPKYNKDGTRAKKDAVQYNCEVCLLWVGSSYVSVDHKNPVISTDGSFVDWNTFYARLDCDISNLQRICDDCHQKKTNEERYTRIVSQDVALYNDMSWGTGAPDNMWRDFVKKFTPKRLNKYPYPQHFKDSVDKLREHYKKKKV
jgi:hypothetical protein